MSDASLPFSQRLDELEAVVRRDTDLRAAARAWCSAPASAAWPTRSRPRSRSPSRTLPGWPAPSAPGHSGRLLLGTLRGLPVACLQGRLHMYEGLSERLVVEPALLLGRLGARILLLTNASGGVNPAFGAGTLMLIRDHINLTGRNPLARPQRRRPRPAVPGHDRGLGRRAARAPAGRRAERGRAARGGRLRRASPGPTYETPAEVRMLRSAGRRRGGHVHGHGGHRRALGGSAGLRRVARHQRRRRPVADAADPRGGAGRGGRGRARAWRGSSVASPRSSPT